MIEGEAHWALRTPHDSRHDWGEKGGTWLEGYTQSIEHPHRKLIIDSLKEILPKNILEVGCNTAPNLIRIKGEFPNIGLAGIDLNLWAIEGARKNIPNGDFGVGNVLNIPHKDKSFDLVLSDAVLMYVDKNKIEQAIKELCRVAKYVLIVDWYAPSPLGVVRDFHWARNYPALIKKEGFKMIKRKKLTKEDWPNKKWIRHGQLFVFQAQ